MKIYDETTMGLVRSQDDLEVELGDRFDIKTSIALVIITFLATQSADFLKSPLSPCWHTIQRISVACLVVSGGLAILELIPKKYHLRTAPDEFLRWVDQVKDSYEKSDAIDPENGAIEHIRGIEVGAIKARFSANSAINEQKSRLMEWSFYFLMASVSANLATLAWVSFWR